MSAHCTRLMIAVGFFFALALAALAQPKPIVTPPAPQSPTLTSLVNLGATVGKSVELTLTGTNLVDPTGVLLGCPATVTIPTDNKNGSDPAKVRIKVKVAEDLPIGLYTIRIATRNGVSNIRPFVVDNLPEVAETDANRTKETAQQMPVPCVVTGRTDKEASDYFKVKVTSGQRLTFEVLARRMGSPLDPIIVLHDGKTMRKLIDLYADDTAGLQADCRLTHTFKEDGEVIVEVRDTTYRGGQDFFYRLRIGEFPGATTAFPLAMQRGKSASIGFTGPDGASVPPVTIKAPKDQGVAAIYATPKCASGDSGWPVPVRLSDYPELVEQEPNDEPAKANKLPVPGGISARFDKPKDVDYFAFTGKKGQKLAIVAATYEVNSPTEVLIRVLDAKGAELTRSKPEQPTARVEFTPPADGEYIIANEHLNYLFGPNEVYHLSIRPTAPEFEITLAIDRYEAPAGGGTAVALAKLTRLNGYGGPIELDIVGPAVLSGSWLVPAGQSTAYIPLLIKAGAKPGPYPFQVRGRAKINVAEVVRYATAPDLVRPNMAALPNLPPEFLNKFAVAVVENPPFALTLSATPNGIEKGQAGKLLIELKRGSNFDAEVAMPSLALPTNVTAALKPIPKGQTKLEIPLTVAANATTGRALAVLRGTAKVGGKDYTVTGAPLSIEVLETKKIEKVEPKKKLEKDKAK